MTNDPFEKFSDGIGACDFSFCVEWQDNGLVYFSASNVLGDVEGYLSPEEIDRLISVLAWHRDKARETGNDG